MPTTLTNTGMIRSLSEKALYVCVFFIPFTGVKGFAFFGELKGEAHIYSLFLFVFLGAISLAKSNSKFLIDRYFVFVFLFATWAMLVFFLDLSDIASRSNFKGDSPEGRFFTQFLVLFVYSLFSYFLYLLVKNKGAQGVYNVVESAVFLSFLVCSVYCVIEMPYVVGYDFTKPFLDWYGAIFRSEEHFDYLRRMRSVSFEAPSFGMFLPIVFGFVIFSKRYSVFVKSVFVFWILSLVYFSSSRSALVLIFLEVSFFLFVSFFSYNAQGKILASSIITFSLILLLCVDALVGSPVFDFVYSKALSVSINTDDEYHLASNLGRWGSQVAAIQIMLDNFWWGVGLGQSGFMLPSYYPDWAFLSFQVRNWSNPSDPLWPPVFSLYTRIGSELGVIGLLVFLYFNLKLLFELLSLYLRKKDEGEKRLAFSVALLFFVALFSFAQFGSFRFVFYWIMLALSVGTVRELRRS